MENNNCAPFTRRRFFQTIAATAALTYASPAAPLWTPASSRPAASRKTLSILNFGLERNQRSDATPALRSALASCKASGKSRLVFPQGTYHFWPDTATEAYIYASNNDAGLKRIAFPLFGFREFEIDGEGSKFVFHGKINPFVLQDSHDIKISNASIDWERPFHNEGKVLSVSDEGLCLEFDSQFPFRVEKGSIFFLGEDNQSCGIRGRDPCPIGNLLEFDTERRETAYGVRDYYNLPFADASSSGANRVCLREPKYKPTVGNTVVFGEPNRFYSAFSISHCGWVELADITIHHAGGMGVIAQRSADLSLNRVKITPSNGRMVSVTADATHFVNCSGTVSISECLFENQLDDATNIHGIYLQTTRRRSRNTLEGRLVHPEQRGVDVFAVGDRIELLHSDDLITYAQDKVTGMKHLNEEYLEITLSSRVPDRFRVGDAIGNITAFPDVTIRGCNIGRNRARGLLLGSRGRILVEHNRFHTPGSAILMEGDARYWFEQAGVRDLTIRNNSFEDCNFGVWGNATIEVGAGIDPSKRALSRYNRNILIENNQFLVFDNGPILDMYSVDELTFRNNTISHDTNYPARQAQGGLYKISDSDNVHVE